jgi:hypothetical protein
MYIDSVDRQPQVLIDRLGEDGERLTGANVVVFEGTPRVEAGARLTLE